MWILPKYALAPLRHPRKRRAVAPQSPPPVLNTVASVRVGAEPDRCVMTFAGADVTGWDAPDELLEVSWDGVLWSGAIDAAQLGAREMELVFFEDVTTATLWRVPRPASWYFADAHPLSPPYAGTIEP
jgi:hypothetical protein